MTDQSRLRVKFLLLVIIFYILDILIQSSSFLFILPIIESNLSLEANFIDMCASIFEIIILGIIYLTYFRFDERRLSEKLSIKKSFVIALGSSGISYLWIILASIYLSDLEIIQSSMEIFEEASSSMVEGAYIWSFLAVCIFGPIMEEILFRGLIFASLEKGLNSSKMAIIISAILFGIWHGIFIQSVYTTIIGITLAYVYSKTRNLKWPILIHIFNNLLSTLPPFMDTEIVNLTLNGLAFLMIIPMIIILKNLNKNENKVLYN